MQKMNPDIKAQWLVALRSGAYTQVQATLHTTDGFCCLGVLLEQCNEGHWDLIGEDEGCLAYVGNGYRAITGLTSPLLHWASLSRETQNILMKMNDDGESFTAIADWIDANL